MTYLTFETALVLLGPDINIEPDRAREVVKEWVASKRLFISVNEDRYSGSFSESNVVRINSEVECIFGSSVALHKMIHYGTRRICFLGNDLEGAVETNIRAACSIPYYCMLGLDVNEFSPDKNFLNRIQRYCDVIGIADMIKWTPLSVRTLS